MTVSRNTRQGRNRTLGTDTEKIVLTLPRPVYEALQTLAGNEYDSIGPCARRLLVAGLRRKGLLPDSEAAE